MSSKISDLKVSIGIFIEFSRNEFLRRYHEYFRQILTQNIDLFSQYGPIGLMKAMVFINYFIYLLSLLFNI